MERRWSILKMWMLVVVALAPSSLDVVAQDSADSTGTTWWVVGSGGSIIADSSYGDTLSLTIGQAAVGTVNVDDSTFGKIGGGIPRARFESYIGFWLPDRSELDEEAIPIAITGPGNVLALSSHPNPFSDKTTISYRLPSDVHVQLRILNSLGVLICILVDEQQKQGLHLIAWDGNNSIGMPLPSGTYFYEVRTAPTAEYGIGQNASRTLQIVR